MNKKTKIAISVGAILLIGSGSYYTLNKIDAPQKIIQSSQSNTDEKFGSIEDTDNDALKIALEKERLVPPFKNPETNDDFKELEKDAENRANIALSEISDVTDSEFSIVENKWNSETASQDLFIRANDLKKPFFVLLWDKSLYPEGTLNDMFEHSYLSQKMSESLSENITVRLFIEDMSFKDAYSFLYKDADSWEYYRNTKGILWVSFRVFEEPNDNQIEVMKALIAKHNLNQDGIKISLMIDGTDERQWDNQKQDFIK